MNCDAVQTDRKAWDEITQIRISAEKNEKRQEERVRRGCICVSPVNAIVAYLNSLDVNYTSGNNVYVLSLGRPETVSVGRLR